jgi:hypothetical protein
MGDFGTIMSHFVLRCHIFWLDLCIFEFLSYRAFQKYAYCLGLKKNFPHDFSHVTSPVSGPRLNFKNSLGYFSHNIKRMCHEKFQGPTTFLLDCKGGPKIGESLCSIKGQTTGFAFLPYSSLFFEVT